MNLSLGIAATAFLLALGLTPLAGSLARRLGMLDLPDAKLKRHTGPVPYLGGLAVYLAFGIALVLFKFWKHSSLIGVVGALTGTSLIVLLGLIDDKFKLPPSVKFAGQILAAVVLFICNMRIQFLPQPFFSFLLSVLWVVGVTNALNLIDIMDGLAGGVSVIACGTFYLLFLQSGRFNDMYLVASLGGAVLGFLVYNFPRAKIYLGDTGALMIGFVLASVAMGGGYSRVNPLAILAPLLVLAVPIFDTLFIMFLRQRRGVSMFRGSPDHLALRLVKLGLSRTQTVLWLWAATALLGGIALAVVHISLQASIMVYAAVGLTALFVAERIGSIPMEPKA